MPGCRRLLAVVLAALVSLSAATACRRGAGTASSSHPFRVALLTPGSIADGGWNQSAYEGLLRIRDQLGAQVANVETKTPAQFEEEFRGFASKGFDLIIGHGFEYQEAAAKVAAEYPHTIFVTTSGNTLRPNLAPIVFELEQATYLCGVVAGRMSRSKLVGLVGGIDLPSIRSTFQAFRAGVESVAPDVQVREVYTGSFDDVGGAQEAARALLEQGADFLMHQANDAGRGVFQAVQERAREGATVYAFGTNKDQNEMAPDVVLASATLDAPSALLEVARAVKEKRFRAEPLRFGLESGVIRLVWNPKLVDRVPAEVRQQVDELRQRIESGDLVVPRAKF
jgi:basic membrane lipoprotein Med (substrate-binding protein (PBP1-ABC) superfamily)